MDYGWGILGWCCLDVGCNCILQSITIQKEKIGYGLDLLIKNMKLSNKTKVLEQGEMTFAERIYLPAIIGGMGTTLKHFFSKKVTIRYPEEKRYLGKRDVVRTAIHCIT